MTGTEIRAIRKSYGENMDDFGKRLGVAGNTVWRWEAEKSKPLPVFRAKLVRLARAKGNGEREDVENIS